MTVPRKRSGIRRAPVGGARNTSRDPMDRFHDEWLGMIQPSDGLVVSKPALADAQVARPSDKTLHDRFLAQLTTPDPATASIANLPAFLADILGLGPERWVAGDRLPDSFRLAVPDTGQLLAPTQALVREAGTSPVALLWELPTGLPLDARETITGGWDYPPSDKFDRLLRHAGVPIGLLSNGTHVRLLYVPHGASTGSLTFPVGAMATSAGRPVLDAFVMLLHATRWFGVAPKQQLPALLDASREAQGRVTKLLADQVLDALHILLAGFENATTSAGGSTDSALAAAYRDPDLGADHVYAGLLNCMLRLVFVLYAEDNDLLPVDDAFYAENLSVLALYEDLAADAGAFPDAMARRFGAYGRLLSLFRAIYFGISHGTLRMPPRHGELFSPHAYPFLEGNRERSSPGTNDAEARRALDPPAIDDETIYHVLRSLLVLGEERLSYKALDVEQIGSVYENLMGFSVVELAADAVCLKKSRSWITGDDLAGELQAARSRWLQAEAGLAKADADRIAKVTAGIRKPEAILDALIECGASDEDTRTAAGRFVIQPSPERNRSASHYTPRSLTARIVEKTLAPLLIALSRNTANQSSTADNDASSPSSEGLLSLKICDPAMGSGAFLVEVVRQLGDHVVAAWRREGKAETLVPTHASALAADDAVAQARRLVAQRCVYGVDKNPQAVTLAKLSLWLVTLAKSKPFSFLDHALRCGDSLVGLDIAQITAFNWEGDKPGEQPDLINREVRDVLSEAVAARERIVALACDDSPEAHAEKERLLGDAQDAVARLNLIGDFVLGAFFSPKTSKEREAERIRRRDLIVAWLASGKEPPAEIVEAADDFRRHVPAFHWVIEFPEVFWAERLDPLDGGRRRAWIDAFVGNPPFLGGVGITGSFGESYLDWLLLVHQHSHGNADLCAHFFRRSAHLLGTSGTMGLVATNTIAQGDTRASGLQWILRNGGVIYDAISTLRWPGTDVAVTVATVHVAFGVVVPQIHAPCLNSERMVVRITSRLRATVLDQDPPDPLSLSDNSQLFSQGIDIHGQGFLLDNIEVASLIKNSPVNSERIFGYLGGDEVNSNPLQEPDRKVISFTGMTLEQASRWPQLLRIVHERVKSERDLAKDTPINRRLKEYWWRYWADRPDFFARTSSLKRILVTAAVSKHCTFSFQSTDRILSKNLFLFAFDKGHALAVLQSRIHEHWARLLSSTMEDRLRYSASACFQTFPFPSRAALSALDAIGEQLSTARACYMARTWQGLTTTYNQLKDPDYLGDVSPASSERPASYNRNRTPWATPVDIDQAIPAITRDPGLLEPETRVAYIHHLRRLHEELDRAVLAAYGWSDILVPPYCPPRAEDRRAAAALSQFEDTVIDRLFALNAQHAAEERQRVPGEATPLVAITAGIKGHKPAKARDVQTTPRERLADKAGHSRTARKKRRG